MSRDRETLQRIKDRIRTIFDTSKMSAKETASELSREFGTSISRNVVIGMWHRMGLSKPRPYAYAPRNRAPRSAAPVREPRAPKRGNIPERKAGRMKNVFQKMTENFDAAARGKSVPVVYAPYTPPADFSPGPVTIETMEFGHCKWPIGDPRDLETFRYCGAARATLDHPYCAAHAAIAFNGIPQRKPTNRGKGSA